MIYQRDQFIMRGGSGTGYGVGDMSGQSAGDGNGWGNLYVTSHGCGDSLGYGNLTSPTVYCYGGSPGGTTRLVKVPRPWFIEIG